MKFPSLSQRLHWALEEDGAFQDVTTRSLPGIARIRSKAHFECKVDGVFCGGFVIQKVFKELDPNVRVRILKKDGQRVRKGTVLARVEGRASALLAGERVVLNLLGRMSGIATLTRQFVDASGNETIAILDTRKTAPLWRDLDRQAVLCGGGQNHRFSLSDAVLVKDNHHQLLSQSGSSLSKVFFAPMVKKSNPKIKFVLIEATSINQVWGAIKARADIILLDNMAENHIKQAMVLIRAARKALNTKAPLAEVSGGVSLKNINRLAKLGVDRISIGALTHSAPVLDISMEVD